MLTGVSQIRLSYNRQEKVPLMEQDREIYSKPGRLACLRLGFTREDLLPIKELPAASIPLKFKQFSEQFLGARRIYLEEQRLARLEQFREELLKISSESGPRMASRLAEQPRQRSPSPQNLYPYRCEREHYEKVQRQKEFARKEESIERHLHQVMEQKYEVANRRKNLLEDKAKELEKRRNHHQAIAEALSRYNVRKASEKVHLTEQKQEAAARSKQTASSEQQARFQLQAEQRREQQQKIKARNLRAEEQRREELQEFLTLKQTTCEQQLRKMVEERLNEISERSRRQFEKHVLAERKRNLIEREQADSVYEANRRYQNIDFKRFKKSKEKERMHRTFLAKNETKTRKAQLNVAAEDERQERKQNQLLKSLNESIERAAALRQDSLNSKVKFRIWEYLREQEIRNRHRIADRQLEYQRKEKVALKERDAVSPYSAQYRIYRKKASNKGSQTCQPSKPLEAIDPPETPEQGINKELFAQNEPQTKDPTRQSESSSESLGDLIQMTNNLHEPTSKFMEELRVSLEPYLKGVRNWQSQKQCRDLTAADVSRVESLARSINRRLEEMYQDVRHKI